MSISASRLAAELAARIAPILPPGFRVTADGTDLQFDSPSGRAFTMPLDWLEEPEEDRSDAERAELVVGGALSSVQDEISEELREPWPELSRRAMALPETRCDGVRLYFWYGPEEQACVIAFAPIVLADVIRVP